MDFEIEHLSIDVERMFTVDLAHDGAELCFATAFVMSPDGESSDAIADGLGHTPSEALRHLADQLEKDHGL